MHDKNLNSVNKTTNLKTQSYDKLRYIQAIYSLGAFGKKNIVQYTVKEIDIKYPLANYIMLWNNIHSRFHFR